MAEDQAQKSGTENFSTAAQEIQYAEVEVTTGTNNIPHHFAVETEAEGIRNGRKYYETGTAAKVA